MRARGRRAWCVALMICAFEGCSPCEADLPRERGWGVSSAGSALPMRDTSEPPECDQSTDAIRRSDDHTFVFGRACWRALRTGRVLPRGVRLSSLETQHVDDGVAIYGVRLHALPGRLGFQNGDVVRRVNGTRVWYTATLWSALAQVRPEGDLIIEIERRHERLSFTYRVESSRFRFGCTVNRLRAAVNRL